MPNKNDNAGLKKEIEELKRDFERLKRDVAEDIRGHYHDGTTATRMELFDIFGMIEVVTAVPTGEPKDIANCLKLYSTGGTYRLYIYDTKNSAWRYATLT